MSYNPFSIDNILADSVPKRCRSSPEQVRQLQGIQVSPCTPVGPVHNQRLPEDQQINERNSSNTTSPDAKHSPSAHSPTGRTSHPSPVPDTPVSSKSLNASPATSTPLQRSRNSEGSISPCQLSPVPSTGSENDHEESKKKKARTSFSVYQIDQLERKFASQRYLGASERSQLAESLNLSDHQVKTWFQNRRMKEKRQIREAEERLGHPVTSLPSHMTTVPSHLIMAPSHSFHGRYSSEIPTSYMALPTMPLGYSTLPQHPLPSVGHEMYQQPFPSPLAPQTSPLGHSLYSTAAPLRVQVGF